MTSTSSSSGHSSSPQIEEDEKYNRITPTDIACVIGGVSCVATITIGLGVYSFHRKRAGLLRELARKEGCQVLPPIEGSSGATSHLVVPDRVSLGGNQSRSGTALITPHLVERMKQLQSKLKFLRAAKVGEGNPLPLSESSKKVNRTKGREDYLNNLYRKGRREKEDLYWTSRLRNLWSEWLCSSGGTRSFYYPQVAMVGSPAYSNDDFEDDCQMLGLEPGFSANSHTRAALRFETQANVKNRNKNTLSTPEEDELVELRRKYPNLQSITRSDDVDEGSEKGSVSSSLFGSTSSRASSSQAGPIIKETSAPQGRSNVHPYHPGVRKSPTVVDARVDQIFTRGEIAYLLMAPACFIGVTGLTSGYLLMRYYFCAGSFQEVVGQLRWVMGYTAIRPMGI